MAIATDLIKNPSSGVANITLGATGGVTFGGAVTGSGMDLVNKTDFSAVSSLSLNNIFTSTYANYRIIFIPTSSSANDAWIYCRLRTGGTDDSAGTYGTDRIYQYSTNIGGDTNSAGDATKWTWTLAQNTYTNRSHLIADIISPALATPTMFAGTAYFTTSTPYNQQNWVTGLKAAVSAYDGLSFFTSSGTMNGTVRVYGYKNS